MNTKESVVNLVVAAGTSSNSVDITPMPGHIIGCVVFKGVINNPGFVQASIKDDKGEFVSKLQHIDNYRSREGGDYFTACKPLSIQGDRKYYFEIIATANFDDDLMAQLVFIHEDERVISCK